MKYFFIFILLSTLASTAIAYDWFWYAPDRNMLHFAEAWLSGPCVWDFNDDGIVNFVDYVSLVE
ncbi:MAG: hypothetical protein KAS32_10520 [Candidatus Peribacteraceae bacterium]|nr:hypothetical protein [Candidatus Peribacteraceae bacterium]